MYFELRHSTSGDNEYFFSVFFHDGSLAAGCILSEAPLCSTLEINIQALAKLTSKRTLNPIYYYIAMSRVL